MRNPVITAKVPLFILALGAVAAASSVAPADSVRIIASEDAFIDSNNQNTNYGGSIDLVVGDWMLTSNRMCWTFIKFPLNEIPSGATILNAELWLYLHQGAGSPTAQHTINVHQASPNWDENLITWKNRPAYQATPTAGLTGTFTPPGWVYWNVTGDVVLSFGWDEDYSCAVKILNDPPYWWRAFYSSEQTPMPDYRPALEVTYLPPPPVDVVVCEPQGGANPVHPSVYWYDVTVGPGHALHDFHVQVYDPDPVNYAGWVEPPGWIHVYQQIEDTYWVSWCDPELDNPLTGTFRFQFTNAGPSTWGDWRTTNDGFCNPDTGIIDQAANHANEPDGYGYRVHVPAPNIHDFNPDSDLEGVWKADSAWGDLDGDGDLDLVYAGESNAGLVTRVYTNQGGTLTCAYDRFGVQNESSGNLALGDLDGDGDLDLVVAGNSNAGPSNRLYRNDGAGNLTWDQTQTLTGLNLASVAWGDYDLDGDLDLYVQGHDGTAARAFLYKNDPLGTLTADAGQTLVGLCAGSADWGDWDGDGDPDLIVTGSDGTSRQTILYKNNPTGTLVNDGNHALPGVSLSDTAWGDLEGDGDLDLAFTGETSAAQRYACVYTNDGTGVFTLYGQNVRAIYRSSCALGDYDNDGDLDVAFCGYDGGGLYTVVCTNTGAELSQDYHLHGVREGSLNWVDVDADGNLDLFMTGADWSQKYARLWRNSGGLLNTNPTPPDMMNAQQCDGLLLTWEVGTDTETPGPGLYYCVRVGTTSGGNEVMSGTYSTPLMGNAGQGAAHWLDLPAHQYFWSVRTIDSGLATSPWSPEQVAWCQGDVNCDGFLNFRDINPFVLLLSNPAAYQAQYPTCPAANGDINCDGTVGFRDINPFVTLIASGVCS